MKLLWCLRGQGPAAEVSVRAFLWSIAAALSFASPDLARAQAAPAAVPMPWNVVLVRNFDALYPANVAREAAMRDALYENTPRPIDIYPESIDTLHFSQSVDAEYAHLLEAKYAGTKVDLVIATGREPLEFATRYRDRIWPGVPIVYNGVFEGELDGWKRPPATTGVLLKLDVKGTLELAREMFPASQTVYFIAGTAPFDRYYLDLAKKELGLLAPAANARFLDGLTVDETIARVAALGPGALVFYLSMFRDGAGRVSVPGFDRVRQVSMSSKVPVLSASWVQYGRGPVGGSSSRFDVHGREAGRLARRVLEGADPDRIAPAVVPAPTCEIDAKALAHWRVSERRVPSRCAITGRVPPIWETNLWQLVALVAVIVLQMALIWALAAQNLRRQRAEAALRLRTDEMAQMGRFSMIGALTASIAHEINQPLGAIRSNAEAAELMLARRGEVDREGLREILADIRGEDARAADVVGSLRKFLAGRETEARPLDLNSQAAESIHHVAYEAARHDVAIKADFGRQIPMVLGDAVQLQQVIINLLLNAIDAVSGLEESRRRIRVTTQGEGQGVEISVADSGTGVAEKDIPHLFEVLFTTKPHGTGLGLSIVRTIVEMHGGRVLYEENPPHGAIFRVWLPAAP